MNPFIASMLAWCAFFEFSAGLYDLHDAGATAPLLLSSTLLTSSVFVPKIVLQGLNQTPTWLCPLVDISMTSARVPIRSAKLGVISEVFRNNNAFIWLEANLEEHNTRIHLLRLEPEGLVFRKPYYSTQYSASVGSGYRYFINPAWMVGAYGYYDKIPKLHTISIGVESHFNKLHFVSNGYFSLPTPEARQGIYPKWNVDAKLESKSVSAFTFAVGAYYRKMVIPGPSYAYRRTESSLLSQSYGLPVLGGVVECAYSFGFFRSVIRLTYDPISKIELSASTQLRLTKQATNTRSITPINRWTQTERYIGRQVATEMILPHQREERWSAWYTYKNRVEEKKQVKYEQVTNQLIKQMLVDNKKQFALQDSGMAHYVVTGKKSSSAKTTIEQDLAVLKVFGRSVGLIKCSTFDDLTYELGPALYREQIVSKPILISDHKRFTQPTVLALLSGLYIPRPEILTHLVNCERVEEIQAEVRALYQRFTQGESIARELNRLQKQKPWLFSGKQRRRLNDLTVEQEREAIHFHGTHSIEDGFMHFELRQFADISLSDLRDYFLTQNPSIPFEAQVKALSAMREVADSIRQFKRPARILTRLDRTARVQLLNFHRYTYFPTLPRELQETVFSHLLKFHLIDSFIQNPLHNPHNLSEDALFQDKVIPKPLPEQYRRVDILLQDTYVLFKYLDRFANRAEAFQWIRHVPYDDDYLEAVFVELE